MDMDKDIAFEIGRFYYGIRDYDNALKYYIESSNTVGEHHVTFHNQGLCYYSKGKLEIALEHFRKAFGINSEYEKAHSWIEKVNKELDERSKAKLATSTSNVPTPPRLEVTPLPPLENPPVPISTQGDAETSATVIPHL